ncbi:MAG: hypothetical protein ING84_17475, partial [Cytophagales bacterium]|nr:hypothetical protein [Cytophagales bacterium]MCA6368961.1 hypothetical protein [Cytophagales bacterium]
MSKFVIHRNQKNWLHPFDFQYRDGSYVLNLTMDITSPLNWLLCLKKRFILVPFVFIGLLQQTIETFGQASPLPNPTYQSPDQRSIVVTFNQAITGSATASDWSVTLGGTPVGIQSVTRISATTVRVLFTPSTVNGVGVNYILPGQLVQISFTNISGSLTTVVGGAPVNGTGGAITAVNNYIPSCADIDFLGSNFYSDNDVCAPVDMNFFQWTYEVSLVYRNSSAYAGNIFFLSVAWGDSFTTNTNSVPSDNLGGATPTFASAGIKLSTQPVAYATIRPTHTYPVTYSLPAPTSCEFIASLTPFFSGLGSCGSKIEQRLFPSYDTDNKNTGALNLPEFVPGSKLVCLGNNVGMMFNDATNLNCRAAVEANAANELTRNIRIIYGSQNYAGGNIPNVFVTLPASLGGATVPITNSAGALIAPNYFPTTGSADINGVINLPASVTAPSGTAFMGTIFTTSPAGQAVGQRLYVKLEYWNICNQYDGIAVTGNQEFVENFIEITPIPSTPVSVDKNFCSGTSINPPSVACGSITVPNQALSFEVTAASVAGSTSINWYFGDPTSGGVLLTNSYGSNCRFFRTGNLSTSGAQGAMRSALMAGTIGTYSLWATRTNTGVNACESSPVEVKMIVNPLPLVGNQSPSAICSDLPFGVNFAASTNGTAAATYNVTALTFTGMSISAGSPGIGTGLAAAALADDAFTNTSTIPRNVVYTVAPVSAVGCVGASFTVTVPVNPEPLVANQTQTRCSDVAIGINFGASSGVAASTYNVTNINFNGLTASAGAPAVANGLANTALADDAYTNTTNANVNVIYTVVPVAATTGCLGNPFTVTFTVQPEPVVFNQTPAAICSDAVVGVNFSASSGGSVAASTYNVTALTLNGSTVSGGGAAVANGLPNTALANDAFTNITNASVNVIYTVVPVSAAGCLGNPFTVTVPVNPEPVVADQLTAAVCSTQPVGVTFSASTNGVVANSYNITALNLNGLTIAAGSPAVGNGLAAGALADDAFNNTTSGVVNVIYTVAPVSAIGCVGNTFMVTVPVNPQPVVGIQTRSVCSQSVVGVNFNPSTSVAAASYNVTILNLNGLTPFAGGPAVANGLAPNALADDAFTNPTGLPVNVVYTVVPVSASGCLGNSFTVTVTVNPIPVGQDAAATPICSSQSVGYNLQTQNINSLGNSVPSSFSWLAVDNVNVSGESLGANTSLTINDVLVNTSGADQTVTYTVTPTSTTGTCLGASFTVSVLVRGPTVSIGGASTQAICAGNTLPLTTTETYTSGSFTSRVWTGSFDENFGAAPAIIASLSNAQMDAILGNRTLPNPTFDANGLGVNKIGAYVLTYTATDNNGCNATAVVTINVSQVGGGILYGSTAGTATTGGLNATVCSGVNLFLDGKPTGGSGIYTTHLWTVVTPPATPIGTVLTAGSTTATPTFNFANSTAAVATFVLRYSVTDNQGCNFTTGAGTDITINVNPQPVVDVQTPVAVCSRTPVGVNFNSSTSVAAATYNVTALNLNGLSVSAGGAGVASGLFATALADDAFLN